MSARTAADELRLYTKMLRIRLFEEQVNELYTSAKMPGLAHLYIGEEAVAVGVCAALRDDDYITSTHRGHGHCLAKGASVDRMFAELLGKEAGYCRSFTRARTTCTTSTPTTARRPRVVSARGRRPSASRSRRSMVRTCERSIRLLSMRSPAGGPAAGRPS